MKMLIPSVITSVLAILSLRDAVAADDQVPAYDGSKLFALELKLPRHWSLGVFSYTGKLVPLVERIGDPRDEEYGVQVGAHWAYPGRIRLSLEIPYTLGRVLPSGAAAGQHVDEVAASVEPHIASVLTISLNF